MNVIVIGSGIAGMSAAIEACSLGASVSIFSPFSAERSQSVMAAGGINAAVTDRKDIPEEERDSIELHVDDTIKGGVYIEGECCVRNLCKNAPSTLRWLESLGVVFNRDKNMEPDRRAFGGQCRKRTAFAGSSTGKHIVSALTQKCREYEISGQLKRYIGYFFHSALIHDGRCFGVIMTDGRRGHVLEYFADAVIMATGGQNIIFGKTTGSMMCDGYAAARLFSQGVLLRNLEMIQYHPTAIETYHKRMLVSEAARGEGGRLYYLKNDGSRCYFMEEKFGPGGNLMPRDIVSKCIYDCPSQVFLDITFLGKEKIMQRLHEVYDLCNDYLNLDVTKESIPVYPAIHFFMGGIKVDNVHETNIHNLFAVGECASKYHGANRLGGNSLLAAVYSGRTAAAEICGRAGKTNGSDEKEILCLFSGYYEKVLKTINIMQSSESLFPVQFVRELLSTQMNSSLGIVRDENSIATGLKFIDYLLENVTKLNYDPELSIYENYRIYYLVLLAKAILMSADARKESRGAHIRSDYPEMNKEFAGCSVAEYSEGGISVSFEKEDEL